MERGSRKSDSRKTGPRKTGTRRAVSPERLAALAVLGIAVLAASRVVRSGGGLEHGAGLTPPGASDAERLLGPTSALDQRQIAAMIAEEVRSHGVIDGVAVSSGEMVVLQGTQIALAPAEDRSKVFHLAGQGEDVPGWRMRYFCPADFNRDDQIDEEDARAFVNEWMDRSGELAPYLDIDMDGLLTERDLDLFFSAFNGTCDPSEQAQMRAIIC